MLKSIKEIIGYTLEAKDGKIGKCKDFLFDDAGWTIRYMVADTGRWLVGRKVLISPIFLGEPNWSSMRFPVNMTRQEIENSPSLEENMPVSRSFETRWFDYFGFPYYWAGGGLWGAVAYPTAILGTDIKKMQHQKDPKTDDVAENRSASVEEENRLRSVKEVKGYHISAADGEIGHVEDFIVDEETWKLRYVVIDTRNWLPGGRNVLISPAWIEDVSWIDSTVRVDLPVEAIRNSPEFDPHQPVNREYEIRLYDYYGRPYYW